MQPKEWTLMFYFASDNPLASTIVSQLKALKDAGYHPDANVIAHFDPHVVNTPVHVFDVNGVNKFWNPGQSEVGFASNDPFVRDLVLDRLWGEDNEEIRSLLVKHVKGPDKSKEGEAPSDDEARSTETPSGETKPGVDFNPPKPPVEMFGEQDPKESLSSFLNFCRESYPARHYLLFILGHGQVVGNDSLLLDDHATRNSLLLTELGEVLRAFNADVQNDTEPGQVEMIGLHSCSMSAMEVAYELRGAANYLLASQGPAYVGSWPYKQILMRVFNDLNSELTLEDINGFHDGRDGKQSLVEKLFKADEPFSNSLRDELEFRTKADLKKYEVGTAPATALVSRIVKDFNRILVDRDTTKFFMENVNSSNGTSQLATAKLKGVNLRRLNRLLLADAFPEIARFPKFNVETMLSKIFYYCLYNSYDFQLAGYPYDLCLTKLTKVSETEEPINALADSLIKCLQDPNPLPKQLILLAHLDAQSFYQEDYVDLYDFCFCLKKRYEEIEPNLIAAVPVFKPMLEACQGMRDVLEKGPENLITRSAFSGAAFQYSHGLSIFFPWTEPLDRMWDEQYGGYRLNRKTRWRDFLDVYFKETMRKTRVEEVKAEVATKPEEEFTLERATKSHLTGDSVDPEVVVLIGRIGTQVFAGDGRVQKPGPDHPMGKYGPDDPTGANCNCPTIKNYPQFTDLKNGQIVQTIPMSEDFLAGKPMTVEPTTD